MTWSGLMKALLCRWYLYQPIIKEATQERGRQGTPLQNVLGIDTGPQADLLLPCYV